MSLLLPYFKMDVIDWLKSERIEQMSNACIGAYSLLLCEAWTRPHCSLPSARLALMKLGRWTGTPEEFEPVVECFEPLKSDKARVINVRLKREWEQAHATVQALSAAGKKGAQIKQQMRTTKKTQSIKPKPVPAQTDWLTTLKANPVYAHVNWPHELGKMQQWLTDHPGRQLTREFVRKWVNKIDPPLPNGAAQLLVCPQHPTQTFPDAHAKKEHDFLYHQKFVR